MVTIFKFSLRRSLGAILGWGLALGLTALYLMALYNPMVEQQAQLRGLFDAYGESMMAFFGGTMDIFSAAGYLDFSFFSYIPVVVGFFAVVAGSGMVAADEEHGTLDLVLAHPVSRTALFFGRYLAFLVSASSILLLTWAGFALGLPITSLNKTAWDLLLPHISLLGVLLLFGGLSLFLSMALPKRSLATGTAGLILVFNYVITSMARINENLEPVNDLLPLKYYQGGQAVNGLDMVNFLGLLGFGLLFALLAWLLFLRRDIRVSGEGNWKLPAWLSFGARK